MLTAEQRKKIRDSVFAEYQQQRQAPLNKVPEQQARQEEETIKDLSTNAGTKNDNVDAFQSPISLAQCQEEKLLPTLPIATKKLTAEQRWKILNSIFNVEEEKPVIKLNTVEATQDVNIDEPLSLMPVEIKTAPIGDCEKCPYKKARGTQSAKCGEKCAESLSYFEWCHNQVNYVDVSLLLYEIGMTPYVDNLKIGYDKITREIILPLNKAQYVAVQLTKGGNIADKESAEKIFSHYHLQPRKNGEMKMRRNEEGKVEIISRNYDAPYLDSCFYGLAGETVIAEITGRS